jgi:hypothetical protein
MRKFKNVNFIGNGFPASIPVIFALLFFCSSHSGKHDWEDSPETLKKLHLEVLEANIIGKNFQYDLTRQPGCNKTKLNYLGWIETAKGKQYKLLNSFWVTGYSCRGVSNLVVYTMDNEYVGKYYFDMPYELPDTLINNQLVYTQHHEECPNRKGTIVSFKNGLPKSFQVCGGIRFFE